MTDNKKFWQTVKPFFSDKVKAKTVIKSVENDEMIDEIICKYCQKKLGIFTEEQTTYSAANQLSQVKMAIIKHIYIYIYIYIYI